MQTLDELEGVIAQMIAEELAVMSAEVKAPENDWQTQVRGNNQDEYQIYLACADNGKGGDITNNGKPLKSFDEWMSS